MPEAAALSGDRPYTQRETYLMIIREATIADVPAIARVHVESSQSSYRGILPDNFLDALPSANREELWRQNLTDPRYGKTTFAVVAEETSVVAFANGGPERKGDGLYDAEIYAIYLLKSQQRCGLGRKMMQTLARSLSNANFGEIGRAHV